MRRVFSIEEKKEVRLWNRYMSNTYEHLSKMDNTLQDAGLYQGQVSVHLHYTSWNSFVNLCTLSSGGLVLQANLTC